MLIFHVVSFASKLEISMLGAEIMIWWKMSYSLRNQQSKLHFHILFNLLFRHFVQLFDNLFNFLSQSNFVNLKRLLSKSGMAAAYIKEMQCIVAELCYPRLFWNFSCTPQISIFASWIRIGFSTKKEKNGRVIRFLNCFLTFSMIPFRCFCTNSIISKWTLRKQYMHRRLISLLVCMHNMFTLWTKNFYSFHEFN